MAEQVDEMPYAREKQNHYQNERLKKRRFAWMSRNGPCSLCGSAEDLEVDHKDPEQKVAHRVWSWNPARAEEELSKCRVLCRKCHHEKHNAGRKKELVHGTRNAFDEKGCRCDLCKSSFRERMSKYRPGGA